MNSASGRAIALLVFASVLLGISPTATKLSYGEGANPQFVILFRSVLAAAGLSLFLLARGEALVIARHLIRETAMVGLLMLVGLGAALASLAYIDVSLATIIWYSHIFMIAIFNHAAGVSRLAARDVLLICLAFAGLSIALGASVAEVDPVGVGLAFASAVGIAAMILGGARLTRAVGPVRANVHLNLWAAVYLLVLVVGMSLSGGWAEPPRMPQGAWGWFLVSVTALTFTLGFLFFFVAAGIIGATRAAVITIIEPILMVLFAVALVGEFLTTWQWLGVAMVIGSLFAIEASQRRKGVTG